MPPLTLRLRLTAAALTLAAALGGAFLISSAPAQVHRRTITAAPMSGMPLIVGTWFYQNQPISGGKEGLITYQPDGKFAYLFPGTARHEPAQSFGTYVIDGSKLKEFTTHASFDDPNKIGHSDILPINVNYTAMNFSISGNTLTIRDGSGEVSVAERLSLADAETTRQRLLGATQTDAGAPPKSPVIALPKSSSIVGSWLCSHDDGTGNVLIFSPTGTVEEVGPWPGSSTAVGHSYGPDSTAGHSYGRYRTAGPNLMYTFDRVWVEGEKPWTTSPEKHRQIYSISGDTLILRWNGQKSVSHRISAYTKAMFGLPSSGAMSTASVDVSNRQVALQQLTAELRRYLGKDVVRAEGSSSLGHVQFLAGLTPVQGPGVVVTLSDSRRPFPEPMPEGLAVPNIIHDTDINATVNELKAAGAEAVAVNGQRLVATSAIRNAGRAILINNTPEVPPFVIKAIGDSKTLAGALTLRGREADQLKAFDPTMFTIQQTATLTLPAYAGKGEMHYAKPVSTADAPAPPSKVILTLDSKGAYFLDGIRLTESRIEPRLTALVRQNPNITAVIKADKSQPYSRVIKLMNTIKQAGVHSVAVMTAASSAARYNVLLSAMQAQRDQLQVQQGGVTARIEMLNTQMQTQRQKFIHQSRQLERRKSSAMTAGETRALLESFQNGEKKPFAASALAAQKEVQKTASLPPDAPARIAAQKKFAPILAKLQFIKDVEKYNQQWMALYKARAEKTNNDRQQMTRLRQQQRLLQALLADINIRIARVKLETDR